MVTILLPYIIQDLGSTVLLFSAGKSISFQMYKVNLKCVCVCVCNKLSQGLGVLTLFLVEQTGLLLVCVSFCNMTFS
jgi:hypothetical protein